MRNEGDNGLFVCCFGYFVVFIVILCVERPASLMVDHGSVMRIDVVGRSKARGTARRCEQIFDWAMSKLTTGFFSIAFAST